MTRLHLLLTESQRTHLCTLHGICSEVECNQPIMGWVIGGRKLCLGHLQDHQLQGSKIFRPERWQQDWYEVVKNG